jgi:glycosyltransferase involved in cell wall biosynthesis
VQQDARVKVLNFSRNFGHQIALTAGLDYATGHAIVLLDADLQDPLDAIHRMIERYCEGFDVVNGQRLARPGDLYMKNCLSMLEILAYFPVPACAPCNRCEKPIGSFVEWLLGSDSRRSECSTNDHPELPELRSILCRG